MNQLIMNNTTFWCESFWRKNKHDMSKDIKGNLFPWPKPQKNKWKYSSTLSEIQSYLKKKEKYYTIQGVTKSLNKDLYNGRPIDCLLCDQKNITHGIFILNKILWEDGLQHYIDVHNINPSEKFTDSINLFVPDFKSTKKVIRYKSKIYNIGPKQFVKLEENQLLILDALLTYGGYTKKYKDPYKKNLYRFSEHSGLLDFNEYGLEKIIVSGERSRVDKDDVDIFLPENLSDILDYEYIFHTHPPTPKPGGRAMYGILYEFPSISDIFHFMDHYNDGNTQGSIVLASEGIYIIRKENMNMKKININEKSLYNDMKNAFRKAQSQALKKYTAQFTRNDFYSKIAQDTKYIDDINMALKKYEIVIDYYPRTKNSKGKWIFEAIYLPIYIIEPK